MTAGLIFGALVFGLAQGGAIALLGAGIVTIHRGSGVLNLAQGAMAMFATYIAVGVAGASGIHPARSLLLGAFAGVVAGAALGVLVDRVAMRPLVGRPPIVRMTATLGVLYILVSLSQLIWGATTRSAPTLFGAGGHRIGAVVISNDSIGVALVALALAVGLGYFYQRTRLGTAIRAVADDRENAGLGGIRVQWVGSVCWALGGAAAAIAGIMLSPTLGLNSFILTLLVIQALAAALTGRLQHLLPTLLGGVGIGVLTALLRAILEHVTAASAPTWINLTDVQDGVALAWMIGAILLWRRRSRDASGQTPNRSEARIAVDPAFRTAFLVVAGLLALVVPLFLHASTLYLLTIGGAYAIAILSLVLLTGMGGQFSLAQASFMGVGAFAAAHLLRDAHMSYWLALPLSGLIAAPFGAITGWITLRAQGVMTAVLTLGVGSVITGLFLSATVNGGGLGSLTVTRPDALSDSVRYCWFVLVVLAVLIAFVSALRTRRTGRVMLAVRDSETAARAVGVNPYGVRVMAFSLSAFIAGIAGVLYAGTGGVAAVNAFGPFNSIALVASGVVGGLGSAAGAVIGGILQATGPSFVSGLPGLSRLADPGDVAGILLGALLLVQVIAFPSGLSRPLLKAEAWVSRRTRGQLGHSATAAPVS
ncbi:MAG: ABC transporter permease [Candidatus Dormibacteraeota bacterium]|nr:ABC transporter permease [Candidatus Dormibacteraeota bacterium]